MSKYIKISLEHNKISLKEELMYENKTYYFQSYNPSTDTAVYSCYLNGSIMTDKYNKIKKAR